MDEAKVKEKTAGRARLVVPVVALLVGVGGGFGASYFMAASGEAAAETEAGAEAAPAEGGAEPAAEGGAEAGAAGAEAAAAPVATSAVTNIGLFTVNLRGGGGGRVLRIEVQVESPPAHAAAIGAKSAQIRDSIITAISDYTWGELEGAGGKTRLRDELLARVNGAAAPSTIDRIYFTQFVVQ